MSMSAEELIKSYVKAVEGKKVCSEALLHAFQKPGETKAIMAEYRGWLRREQAAYEEMEKFAENTP